MDEAGPHARADQKEASREADRAAVRAGTASYREINQANGILSTVPRDRFRILSVRGKVLDCPSTKT
jgi:hypothetical protein